MYCQTSKTAEHPGKSHADGGGFLFWKHHQLRTSLDPVVHWTALVYMSDQGPSIYYPIYFLQNQGSKTYKADNGLYLPVTGFSN